MGGNHHRERKRGNVGFKSFENPHIVTGTIPAFSPLVIKSEEPECDLQIAMKDIIRSELGF